MTVALNSTYFPANTLAPENENGATKEIQNIVILHGLFGSASNWQSIARKLSANYNVYTLDARNHGLSPHDDVIDYPSMAKDLERFLQAKQLYNVVLLGHSMGGKTVMWLTLTKNIVDRVTHLVIVDIVPGQSSSDYSGLIQNLTNLDINALENRAQADGKLKEFIEDPGLRSFLLQNLVRTNSDGFAWRINLEAIQRYLHDIMSFPTIPIHGICILPTLLLFGANSNYVQGQDLVSMTKLYPNLTSTKIEGAGHWVHAEQPLRFYELLVNWLQQ